MTDSDSFLETGPRQGDASDASGNSAFTLNRIRRYIEEQGAIEGTRLPTERQFSAMFGVGRRAVRRALDALETEGVISRKQGAGTFLGACAPSAPSDSSLIATTDFAEIMEVRLRIEPQLAQLAALRARPRDIERMRALSDKIAESRDADARELWDGSLHRLIAQAAGNALFLSLFDTVNRVRQDETWQALREHARSGSDTQSRSVEHHNELIESIARRDPVAAADVMRRHLLMLQENLIRQTSLDSGEAAPAAGTKITAHSTNTDQQGDIET